MITDKNINHFKMEKKHKNLFYPSCFRFKKQNRKDNRNNLKEKLNFLSNTQYEMPGLFFAGKHLIVENPMFTFRNMFENLKVHSL